MAPRLLQGNAKQMMGCEGNTFLLLPSRLVLILLLRVHEGEYHSCFYYLLEAHQGYKIETIAVPEDPSWAFFLLIP